MIGGQYGPGPGAYDVSYQARNGMQAKMGTSNRGDFNRVQTPGPGAYELINAQKKGITISGFKSKLTI